jgi:hypothetical protein
MTGTVIFAEDLPGECIEDCSAPGVVDDAVAYWVREPSVAAVLHRIAPDRLRRCLRGYGTWDNTNLADDDANRRRILWLACSTFREGDDIYIVE